MANSTVAKIISVQSFSLLIFLFLLPLLFPAIFADSFEFPKAIFFYYFFSFSLVFFGFSLFVERKIYLPAKKNLALLLIFIIIQLVSTIFSVHPAGSFFGTASYTGGFLYLLGLVFIFLLSFNLSAIQRLVNNFFLYLVASGFLAAFYGLYQFANHALAGNFGFRIRSTLGEPNRLAYFLAIVFPLSFVFFLKNKDKGLKFLFLAISFIIIVALFLTASRSAWLALLASTLIVVFHSRKLIWREAWTINKKVLFIFIFFLLIFFYFQGKFIFARIATGVTDLYGGGGSTNIRLWEWKIALKSAANPDEWYRFFIGTGPQTARYTFLKNRDINLEIPPNQRFWRLVTIRNLYLDYLINSGIFGLLTYMAFLMVITKMIFQNRKGGLLFWGICWSWLTIVASGFFYYQTIVISCFFWVLTAIILGLATSPKKVILPKSFRFFGFIPIFTGLVFLVGTTQVGRAEFFAWRNNYQMAAKINPYNDLYWRVQANNLAQEAYEEKNFPLMLTAFKAGETALSLNRFEPQNLQVGQKIYYLAASGFDKKYHSQAFKLAQLWLEADPVNPEVYDSLGLIFLDQGETQKAYEYFKKSIEINPDFFIPYLHAGETLKQQGKFKEAIKFYQQAVSLQPNSVVAHEELQKASALDNPDKSFYH